MEAVRSFSINVGIVDLFCLSVTFFTRLNHVFDDLLLELIWLIKLCWYVSFDFRID